MTRRDDLMLFAAGLLALLVVAYFQHAPGYMDADYYLLNGQQLAAGRGLNEPVIWNYLDDPQELPHPSHAYWMPLPSFVAAAGAVLFGGGFAGGRVFFILLAAAVPPLAAWLALALTGSRGQARLAGWLAVFSGFYLAYLPTTDSFGLGMLLGAGFFFLLTREQLSGRAAFGLGALAGLLHLARAEGLLWLALALAFSWRRERRAALATLSGYALVMGPWLLRNLLAFGSLLAPGAGRTLWLTSYDELFTFPASQLDAAHWLASGWGAIIGSRLSALGQNLASALVVEGFVFLAPLAIWGAWKLRSRIEVRAATAAWLALLFAMSIAFPFSGARGGFFHAAAALQPMVWALAAAGLGALVEWGGRVRNWQSTRAGHIFSAGALLLALGLSIYAVNVRVIGADAPQPVWNASAERYAGLADRLRELGIGADSIVMVNNPPGFVLASGNPAIVIPNGGVSESLRAGQQFGAAVLLLEANHPAGWDEIYAQPHMLGSLRLVETYEGTHVFFLNP
jgi:hypothetical protein